LIGATISILDCTSFDSTLVSLEAIIGLPSQSILDTIGALDCEQFSRDHPNDYRNLKEILVDLLCQRDAVPHVPAEIHWFHGTRVLQPDSLRAGIRPLNEQIEQIWQDLCGLAQRWVSEHEWNTFRRTVETTDSSETSVRYRHRLSNQTDLGPHAVLVRDALMDPERFCGVNYLQTPETIEDICLSFQQKFGHNLLAWFQESSRACIVKFRDEQPRPDAIAAAAAYVWCIVRGEQCVLCNTCYEANGKSISGTQILEVVIVS
jgi:hypothetical protein